MAVARRLFGWARQIAALIPQRILSPRVAHLLRGRLFPAPVEDPWTAQTVSALSLPQPASTRRDHAARRESLALLSEPADMQLLGDASAFGLGTDGTAALARAWAAEERTDPSALRLYRDYAADLAFDEKDAVVETLRRSAQSPGNPFATGSLLRLEALGGKHTWLKGELGRIYLAKNRVDEALAYFAQSDIADSAALGSQLARVGRVFAAEAAPEPVDASGHLDLVELGLKMLFQGPAPSAERRTALVSRLSTVPRDPVAEKVPALEAMTDAFGVFFGETSADEVRDASTPGAAWFHWMLLRSRLRDGTETSLGIEQRSLPASVSTFTFDLWRTLYGAECLPAEDPPALEHGPTALLMHTLHRARRGDWSPVQVRLPDEGDVEQATQLTGLAARVFRNELELESRFWTARRVLASGDASAAQQELSHLAAELESAPWATADFWSAAVAYWHAVATARTDPTLAERMLTTVLGGPNDTAVRGQLALVLVSQGDIDRAAEMIAGAPADLPSVAYAHALVDSRRGDAAGANRWLNRLLSSDASHDTHYHRAGLRLKAALLERTARRDDARALHIRTITDFPEDAVTAARLIRLETEAVLQGRAASSDEWVELAMKSATSIGWGAAYTSAYRGVASPETDRPDSVVMPSDRADASALAWARLNCRALLARGRYADVERLTKDSTDPQLQLAHFAVKTWRFAAEAARLTTEQSTRTSRVDGPAGDPNGEASSFEVPAGLRRDAESLGLETRASSLNGVKLQTWQAVLEAVSEGRLDALRAASDARFGAVHDLLFGEAGAAREAAVLLLGWLREPDHNGWSSRQAAWLELMASSATADDAQMVRASEKLWPPEPSPPVRAADVWTANATALLRTGRPDELLPLSEDIDEDPEVHVIKAIADVQQALATTSPTTALKNLRQAQQELRQALG